MSLKNWEINGCSLPLDLEDAEAMERYEAAFDKMAEEEKTIPKDGRQSARIRAYCVLYHHLYDNIWGEGTAERIFKGKPMNTAVYDDVYYSFLDFVRAQTVNAAQKRAEKLDKYRPNRAQKRAAKRK